MARGRAEAVPRRLLLRSALAALAAGLAPTGRAQQLEIIELKHRPADQLLPLLRPLAGNAALSGSGFTLFVRASAADLAQLRKAVASLDRAQRMLSILVRQESGANSGGGGVGGRVVIEPGNSRGSASVWERTATASESVAQKVTVAEGGSAWISTGTSTLVPQRSVARTPGGVVIQESAVERNYDTGFSVSPRVNGDNVVLEIAAGRSVPVSGTRGTADTSRVATTVSGRLGEWIEVGSTNVSQSESRSGVMARSGDAAALEKRVWLKVEEVRP